MTSIANICRLNLNGQITERTADDSVWESTVPAGGHAELSALAFRGPIRTRLILAGPGASCLVKCVYLAAGQDKIDNCKHRKNKLSRKIQVFKKHFR